MQIATAGQCKHFKEVKEVIANDGGDERLSETNDGKKYWYFWNIDYVNNFSVGKYSSDYRELWQDHNLDSTDLWYGSFVQANSDRKTPERRKETGWIELSKNVSR